MIEVINFIDNYLKSKNLMEINAVDANALLAKAGILRDSHDRPGKPLREILRKGKIPHAYQNGTRWLIPTSKQFNKSTSPLITTSPPKSIKKVARSKSIEHLNIADLLRDDQFKSAHVIDSVVADKPGIYCIRILNPNQLPILFRDNLLGRKHDILYISIATKSLKKRFLNQELRAIGHGTFFRSLGAMLGYRPVAGSLVGKANTRNYKFSNSDNNDIISWINSNLKVNWIVAEDNFQALENELIEKHLPLLNLAKNPMPFSELSKLRSECVRIANIIK